MPTVYRLLMTYIFYLDRYHLGDPLFLNGFARDVRDLVAPCLVVHGAGEAAERALEARGRTARWEEGVLIAETAEDRALVVRAARDLNRQIAHALNDAGVAAVALEAGGRGLLRHTETGLRVGNADWLREIVERRAVPVVSALVSSGDGGVREVNGGAVAGVLARALAGMEENVVVMFIGKNRLPVPLRSGYEIEETSLENVPHDVFPEPEAVLAALRTGAEVRALERPSLRRKPLDGTRIAPIEPKESP